MTFQEEHEYKLRATAPIEIAQIDALIREVGCSCPRAESEEYVDTYFDDALSSLRANGCGLRWRRRALGGKITWKSTGQRRDGGLFVRRELEASWDRPEAPGSAADLPDSVRDAVEPWTLRRPLHALLQLRVRRERRLLECDGQSVGELVLDHVQVTDADDHGASFVEVELEFPAGTHSAAADATRAELLHCLGTRLPLIEATTNKLHHAAALLGLETASLAEPAPCEDDAPLATAVAAALQRQLRAFTEAEIGVRQDLGPEPLHEARVAIRRMRVLVRAFPELWPEADHRWLQDSLAVAGRELGALRDLDVVILATPTAIAQLPEALRRAEQPFLQWLRDRRDRVRDQVQAWLRGEVRLGDMERVRDLCGDAGRNTPPIDPAVPPGAAIDPTNVATQPVDDNVAAILAPPRAPTLGAAWRERLRKSVRQVRRLGRQLPPDLALPQLHALRIAIKRLRYLLEEFRNQDDRSTHRVVRRLVRLQQRLGEVCDHEVAATHHLEWLPLVVADAAEPIPMAAMLGGLAAAHQHEAMRLRRRAARTFAQVDRKRFWRRLVPA